MISTPTDNSLAYAILEPAFFKLDGGAMYGIIPKPMWNRVHPADEMNRVNLALRLWVIRSKDRLVVVDTGIGDYHDEKFEKTFDVRSSKDPLEQALNQLGLSCDQVTDLVISHLHFDHVGGIGKLNESGELVSTFPNAHCHIHKEHWHYAHHATPRDAGSFHTHSFDPIIKDYYEAKGMLTFYEGEEGLLFMLNDKEELRFKVSFGHTPWLMHPYTKDFLYLTDLVPTSNHVHLPWVMGYDISPGETTLHKEKLFDFIIQKNLDVIFEHDPIYWGSKLGETKKGRIGNIERHESETGKLSYPVTRKD
ncbi:MAG: MBL fold metallo-hydrolase [Bdellovibrionota bacterium]|nr:MBL fold metallo-hydrolase [Bdellovibrionota bacterium]